MGQLQDAISALMVQQGQVHSLCIPVCDMQYIFNTWENKSNVMPKMKDCAHNAANLTQFLNLLCSVMYLNVRITLVNNK